MRRAEQISASPHRSALIGCGTALALELEPGPLFVLLFVLHDLAKPEMMALIGNAFYFSLSLATIKRMFFGGLPCQRFLAAKFYTTMPHDDAMHD